MSKPTEQKLLRLLPRWVGPRCPVCGKEVPLETAKTDEWGRAIHDDCYLLTLRLKRASSGDSK